MEPEPYDAEDLSSETDQPAPKLPSGWKLLEPPPKYLPANWRVLESNKGRIVYESHLHQEPKSKLETNLSSIRRLESSVNLMPKKLAS